VIGLDSTPPEQIVGPAAKGRRFGVVYCSVGQDFVVVLSIHGDRHRNLAGVVSASCLIGFGASLAEDGEQNCCQDRDDRDHYQQFNQGETTTVSLHRYRLSLHNNDTSRIRIERPL
jgi:hypothetical protein